MFTNRIRWICGRGGLLLCLVICWGCSKKVGEDWSGRQLKPVTGNVENVVFTIDLPDGMKRETDSPLGASWIADKGDYFSEPGVVVSKESSFVGTAKDARAIAFIEPKHIVTREEVQPDGFVLSYHTKDHGTVKTILWKKKGDVVLRCSAGQAKTGGIPNFEATQPWLEKICLSLTIK